MRRDPDVIVIGSGPNGLVAAIALARAGLATLVLEAHPHRAGGALGTEESTLPGFRHDVGAAFFPFARKSPAFRALGLDRGPLRWCDAPIESAHPAPDGSVACILRDLERNRQLMGHPEDGEAWARLVSWHASVEEPLLDMLLSPLPPLRAALRLGPAHLLRFASLNARSGRSLAQHLFRHAPAQRVLPGLALHVDAGPDDTFGAGIGYMLGLTAATGGYPVPEGGAGALTAALVRLLEEAGGELLLRSEVERIVVRSGRAVALRLSGGEELRLRRAVVADTSAPALLLKLLGPAEIPRYLVHQMRRFQQAWGTFKMDWALSGPVPWASEEARQAAVVHAGDDLDDLARFTAQVRAGELPQNPYLVIGQQSLWDPSRAPAGRQTLWAYSRVPSHMPGGWAACREQMADLVEQRIEGLAPGFRQLILARHIMSPERLEAMDQNLVGGDLAGGSNAWNHLLFLRPAFPWFDYQMPVPNVYLGSSYAHPGAGVHGMCGWNAAQSLLSRL